MQLTTEKSVAIILVVAAVTFLTRLFPFILFGGKREVPAVVRYLGAALPPAVMAVLLVYGAKDIDFLAYKSFLPHILGILVTAVLHLWKRNNLLSIGGGTVCYMLLIQLIFV